MSPLSLVRSSRDPEVVKYRPMRDLVIGRDQHDPAEQKSLGDQFPAPRHYGLTEQLAALAIFEALVVPDVVRVARALNGKPAIAPEQIEPLERAACRVHARRAVAACDPARRQVAQLAAARRGFEIVQEFLDRFGRGDEDAQLTVVERDLLEGFTARLTDQVIARYHEVLDGAVVALDR